MKTPILTMIGIKDEVEIENRINNIKNKYTNN